MVKLIYVKNTLIQRLHSFSTSSDITSDDIERVKQENERLKQQVQTIQTSAADIISSYKTQNENFQNEAQNVQNILAVFCHYF